MSQIRRVIAKAAMRLWFSDAMRVLAIVLTGALAAVLITRLVQQVFGLLMPWREIAYGVAGGVVVVTLVWSYLARKNERQVAIELDERANLRESLSTALYVEKAANSSEPWSMAVLETARVAAASVKVGQAIPIQAPKTWPVPLATGAILAIVWFTVDPIDVLGKHAERVAAVEQQKQVQEVKAQAAENRKLLEEKLAHAKAADLLKEQGDPTAAEAGKEIDKDPDALRRAEVRQLTGLTEKLEQLREGDKAEQLDAMKEAMRQLRQPGPGPMEELARSMARGDFNKANEELRQLEEKLGDGSMSQEQKDALKEQMENLAKQMQKVADQKQELAEKMEQQGLDKKTAQELAQKAMQNPEDLKKAVEQMQNMTEEQKEALKKMAESAGQCSQQCENMGEALSKMAQGMMQEGLSQEGMQGMEEMAQQLSEMEMLSEDMKNLDAALDEAQRQLADLGKCLGGEEGECEGGGIGQWREGDSTGKKGNGSGGPGKGNGPSPNSEAVDYATEKVKANVKTQGGPIIGTKLTYGQQLKGQSVATFEEAIEAGSKAATEAMEDNAIEREFQDPVKHYFGKLDAKIRAEKGEKAPADGSAPKAEEKPAENAEPAKSGS